MLQNLHILEKIEICITLFLSYPRSLIVHHHTCTHFLWFAIDLLKTISLPFDPNTTCHTLLKERSSPLVLNPPSLPALALGGEISTPVVTWSHRRFTILSICDSCKVTAGLKFDHFIYLRLLLVYSMVQLWWSFDHCQSEVHSGSDELLFGHQCQLFNLVVMIRLVTTGQCFSPAVMRNWWTSGHAFTRWWSLSLHHR